MNSKHVLHPLWDLLEVEYYKCQFWVSTTEFYIMLHCKIKFNLDLIVCKLNMNTELMIRIVIQR